MDKNAKPPEGSASLRLAHDSHRRFNPLTGEWVLVSPHRTARPWQGRVEDLAPAAVPAYDPECYLCPGNCRAGGVQNPSYAGTFVFDNDYAALRPDAPTAACDLENAGLIRAESERGVCRVVCFSPRHDLTLASMAPAEIQNVVDVWAEQYRQLGGLEFTRYVQIFENRGAMMGASNPHPHCQIWATSHLPNEVAKEQAALAAAGGECLLCRYLRLELALGERVVLDAPDFAVVVPFWAVWPFETLLLAKPHVGSLDQLAGGQRAALAETLHALTGLYDRVFGVPFPYSMGFHQSPTDGASHEEWHLHAHYYPPLLRSATVRKFMVGFELLGMPQRDITPETAAVRLRAAAAELQG